MDGGVGAEEKSWLELCSMLHPLTVRAGGVSGHWAIKLHAYCSDLAWHLLAVCYFIDESHDWCQALLWLDIFLVLVSCCTNDMVNWAFKDGALAPTGLRGNTFMLSTGLCFWHFLCLTPVITWWDAKRVCCVYLFLARGTLGGVMEETPLYAGRAAHFLVMLCLALLAACVLPESFMADDVTCIVALYCHLRVFLFLGPEESNKKVRSILSMVKNFGGMTKEEVLTFSEAALVIQAVQLVLTLIVVTHASIVVVAVIVLLEEPISVPTVTGPHKVVVEYLHKMKTSSPRHREFTLWRHRIFGKPFNALEHITTRYDVSDLQYCLLTSMKVPTWDPAWRALALLHLTRKSNQPLKRAALQQICLRACSAHDAPIFLQSRVMHQVVETEVRSFIHTMHGHIADDMLSVMRDTAHPAAHLLRDTSSAILLVLLTVYHEQLPSVVDSLANDRDLIMKLSELVVFRDYKDEYCERTGTSLSPEAQVCRVKCLGLLSVLLRNWKERNILSSPAAGKIVLRVGYVACKNIRTGLGLTLGAVMVFRSVFRELEGSGEDFFVNELGAKVTPHPYQLLQDRPPFYHVGVLSLVSLDFVLAHPSSTLVLTALTSYSSFLLAAGDALISSIPGLVFRHINRLSVIIVTRAQNKPAIKKCLALLLLLCKRSAANVRALVQNEGTLVMLFSTLIDDEDAEIRTQAMELLGVIEAVNQSEESREKDPLQFIKKVSRDKLRELTCCICLTDVESEEEAACLPCLHGFHMSCIKVWLYNHSTCPQCRASVFPSANEA